jgi:hypothetical protein
MHGDDDVKIDTKIEMDVKELVAFTYFAGSKTGQKYLYESGKIALDYAGKQLALTGRTFVADPVKKVATSTATRRAAVGVVRQVPTLALATGYAMAIHAIGQTSVGQMARKRTLYKTIRSGMV